MVNWTPWRESTFAPYHAKRRKCESNSPSFWVQELGDHGRTWTHSLPNESVLPQFLAREEMSRVAPISCPTLYSILHSLASENIPHSHVHPHTSIICAARCCRRWRTSPKDFSSNPTRPNEWAAASRLIIALWRRPLERLVNCNYGFI